MSDNLNLSSSIDDCPPEEKSGGGKKGPIVRMEEHVKRLQEAAGLEGDDIDGMLGPKSSEAIAKLGINNPEILKNLPAEIRESIDAIKQKLGKGMFEQHIKDPGECEVDGSAAEGLLHHDGGKGLYISENPNGPLAQPKAEEQIIKAPLARPKYDADGNKFGTDPSLLVDKDNFTIGIKPLNEFGDKPGSITTLEDIKEGTGGIKLLEDDMLIELDQPSLSNNMGVYKIQPSTIDSGMVREGPLHAQMGPSQEELLQRNNSAILDTSNFVQNAVHGVAGKLKEMFFTADANTGAPLDNPEQAPVAANLTTKPNPAAWSMSA